MSSHIVVHCPLRLRDVGLPLTLEATEPVVLAESMPDPRVRRKHVSAYVAQTEIQNVPTMSVAATNTERTETTTRGSWHREGGWPLSVDKDEAEEQSKFCKRVERDEDYLRAAAQLVRAMNQQLRLNSAIDIYQTYFNASDAEEDGAQAMERSGAATKAPQPLAPAPLAAGGAPSEAAQRTVLKEMATTYADEVAGGGLHCAAKFAFPAALFPTQRVAVHGAWTCGSESTRLVVAYADTLRGFTSPMLSEAACAACLWDIGNPSAPLLPLTSRHGDASAVACSSKDPHVVVGGSSSGAVVTWDTRCGSAVVASSAPGAAHRDSVTDIRFLMSKNAECVTVGLDGRALFWDARQLGCPRASETVELLVPESGQRCSATCLDYDPMVGGAHKFLVGSVEGRVYNCNRRGRATSLPARYGVVFDVMRCPSNPKVFLAAGDWGFALFGDELPTPFLSSGLAGAHVTAARWHPRRPAVVMTGSAAGELALWDLCQSHLRPVARVRVSASSIRRVLPHVGGASAAVLDAHGDAHLVALPRVLHEPFAFERVMLNAALEREYARERAAVARERRGTAFAAAAAPSGSSACDDGALGAAATASLSPLLVVNDPQLSAENGAGAVLQEQLRALGERYLADVGFTTEGGDPLTSSPPPARADGAACEVRVASPEIETVDEVVSDDDDGGGGVGTALLRPRAPAPPGRSDGATGVFARGRPGAAGAPEELPAAFPS